MSSKKGHTFSVVSGKGTRPSHRRGPKKKSGNSASRVRGGMDMVRPKTEINSGDRLGLFKEFALLGTAEQEEVLSSVSGFPLEGTLIGAVVASQGRLTAVFEENDSTPQLIRVFKDISREQVESLERSVAKYAQIATKTSPKVLYDSRGTGSVAYIRSFEPNTLRDAFFSNFGIDLPEVLKALVTTLNQLIAASEIGLVHGHVVPGNICFKGDTSGELLDFGVLTSQVLNSESADKDTLLKHKLVCPDLKNGHVSSATDVWGFGATLEKVLSDLPHQDPGVVETFKLVFKPLITATKVRNPDERISLQALKSMYRDIMPILFEEETEVQVNPTPIEDSASIEPSGDEVLSELDARLDTSSDVPEVHTDATSHEANLEPHDELDDVNDLFTYSASRKGTQDSQSFSNEAESFSDNSQSDLLLDPVTTVKDDTEDSLSSTPSFIQIFLSKLAKIVVVACLIYFLFSWLKKSNVEIPDGSFVFGGSEQVDSDPYLGDVLKAEELQSAWASGVPSQMRLVAEQATFVNPGRVVAERVVLGALQRGDIQTSLVDDGLLRIAFSQDWEEDLDESDRRYALALGLAPLLNNAGAPKDLGSLRDRHPGVILALMSSGSQNTKQILKSVPASILEGLPTRYGAAFQLLNSAGSLTTAADDDLLTFARFATRGFEEALLVRDFLQNDFKRKMTALAVLSSGNQDFALKLLDLVIAHPNFDLERPEILWARKVEILNWKSVSATDKIFFIAGIAPRKSIEISPSSVAKLFLNPSPEVRGYAAGQASELINFRHPAALEILTMVKDAPGILSAEQLIMLGQILEDPKKTAQKYRRIVKKFVESNPPLDLAKMMLLATASLKLPTVVDSALAVYVDDKGWDPTLEELQRLCSHPDKVTRTFAYQHLLTFSNPSEALVLLKSRVKLEKDAVLKSQVQEMVKTLSLKQKMSR